MGKKEIEVVKKPKEMKTETRVNFEKVLSLMLGGHNQPTERRKKYEPMTMREAVKIVGISEQAFIYYINSYPELKKKYEMIRSVKREVIGNTAEHNLHRALGESSKIDELDKAKLSLDYLKQTDRAYTQKVEAVVENRNLNFNISEEELKQRIFELMNK